MYEKMKKALSILLCLCMLLQNGPVMAFAADTDNLCEHHAAHTAECGYVEAVEGSDCTHSHDDTCGYVQAVDEVKCACEAVDENGALVHTEGCGYVAPIAGAPCTHSHDGSCGYVQAVEGHPCHYECTACADLEPPVGDGSPVPETTEDDGGTGNPSPTVCTCGTDDPAIHATFCDLYTAPEDPKCCCVEKCGVETQNFWCDVCGFDYTECAGLDSASVATYDALARGNETNRYYFVLPADWIEDGAEPSAYIYWWEGTDACISIPGYKAAALPGSSSIFYYDVPQDVTAIIWNSGNVVGNVFSDSTVDIEAEYYDSGESDLYPDGTINFEGMIYVIDPDNSNENPFTGQVILSGEWYYFDPETCISSNYGSGNVDLNTLSWACTHVNTEKICTDNRDGTHDATCAVCFKLVVDNEAHTTGQEENMATCTTQAVCDTCGASYGEVDADAHSYGDWVSNGDGTHKRTCANDSTHTENGDCSGGTATCTTPAVCESCGASYGEVGGHSYNTSGSCTACGGQAAAKIGDTYYATLAEAAAEVTQGGTIEVLTDVTIGADETLTFAAFAILDVAEGKTVTCSGTVKIGEKDGILFENALYYDGGDITNDRLNLYNAVGRTYYKAGDGYILYDGSGKLELHDATLWGRTYSSTTESFAIESAFDLTIAFYGTNSISGGKTQSASCGINCDGSLTLTGMGGSPVLNISSGEGLTGDNHAVYSTTVTITAGTVNASSTDVQSETTCGVSAETITVESGAVLNATAGKASHVSAGIIGSVVNRGEINAAVLSTGTAGLDYAVMGNAVLSADQDLSTLTESGMTVTFRVPTGTSLTVNEGVTVDLSKLAVTDIDFTGTVINNGTIILPADYALDNAPKSGTVKIGEKSYTWDSANNKWVCGEGSHVFGTDGSCTACGVQAAASVTKSVAGGTVGGGSTTYYETLDAAIQAVSTCTAGDYATVKLLADIDLGSTTQRISGGVFTLDLNGKTITGSNINVLYIDGGTVTIADSAEGGRITCTDEELPGTVALSIEGGTVTVAGGTIRCSKTGVMSTAVQIKKSGNLTVSGGNIIGEGNIGIGAYGGIVTITGGTITGAYFDIHKSDDGTLTLTLADGKTEGATFPGGIKVIGITLGEILGEGMAYWQGDKMIVPADDQIEITGGDVTVREACRHENGTAAYTLTADGIQHVVSWSCCGATVTEDHTMDVTTGKCVCGLEMAEVSVTKSVAGGIAGIGTTTYYETLNEAIQAVSTATAGDNAVVKLLADVDLGSTIQSITGGVFTLDLNGKTITGSYNIVLDITGGNVTIADSAEGGCITCTCEDGFPVALRIGGGTVTVTGGTIHCSKSGLISNAVQINSGNLTVSGGYIIGEGYRGIAAFGGIVTITGGTITGAYFDILKSDDGTLTLTLADGKTEGATFPGGIKVSGITLGEILGSGMACWQGDKMIVPADDQIEITGGDVTVREACRHENGTAAYTPTADGMQHVMTWSCCGATVTEDHTFTDGTCRCGTRATYPVTVTEVNSLGGNPYLTNTEKATHGVMFSTFIKMGENADAWYTDVVKVKVGGRELVKGEDYTYNPQSVYLIIFDTSVTGPIEIFAQVNAKVTFELNGGDVEASRKEQLTAGGLTVTDGKITMPLAYGVPSSFGSTVEVLNQIFLREGYRCTGLKNGENNADMTAPVVNCTLTVQWTANEYTVTWNVDGTETTSTQTYGAALVLPAAPTKDGVGFKGWFTQETGGEEVDENTIFSSANNDTVYYAQWCDHTNSTHTTATDNGDGTHSFECSVCKTSVTEGHTMDTATGKCVCGQIIVVKVTRDGAVSYYTDIKDVTAGEGGSGAVLTVLRNITLTESKALGYMTLEREGDATITVPDGCYLSVNSNSAVTWIDCVGYLAVQKPGRLEISYRTFEKVNGNPYFLLKDHTVANTSVNSSYLNIAEGATLTVAGTMDVSDDPGQILVYGKLVLDGNAAVTNAGEIRVNGTLELGANAAITNSGTILLINPDAYKTGHDIPAGITGGTVKIADVTYTYVPGGSTDEKDTLPHWTCSDHTGLVGATCITKAHCVNCGDAYETYGDHSIDTNTGECLHCGQYIAVATVSDGTTTLYAGGEQQLKELTEQLLNSGSRTITVAVSEGYLLDSICTAVRNAVPDENQTVHLTVKGVTVISGDSGLRGLTQLASLSLPDVTYLERNALRDIYLERLELTAEGAITLERDVIDQGYVSNLVLCCNKASAVTGGVTWQNTTFRSVTYTEHDYENSRCTVCGEVCDHSKDITATDNGDGTHKKTCNACGHVEESENHTLTYTANGSTITESCSANCGYSASLTLKAPAHLVYDRTEKAATVEGEIIADYKLTYSADAVIMAGDYTATLTVGDYSVSLAFTIAKADPDVVTPSDLKATYGQTLADVELPGGWAWKNSSASVGSVGSNTFAAIYTPANISNFNTLERDLTVVVAKAMPTVTAPVAADDLVYNGTEQALITAGTATGGTMQYSLDGSNWSETIPTGKDAKTYTVYYKVVGDSNHNDADGGSVSVTIAPKVITNPVIEGIDAQYLHTGSAITPVPTAVKDGNTVIDPSEYTLTYENNINEGTATLKIVDVANGNYTVSGSKTFQIVVHAHVWNYSASGNTITATCNGNFGTCPDAEQSFTLNAPDVGYSGNPVEAEVTRDGTDLTFTLHYTGINYDSADAPTNAGDYTVTMTVGDKSVSDTFTISPKDISKVASCQFSLTQISFVYSGKAPVLNVTGVDSSIGSYTMQEGTDYTVGTVQVNAGSHKLTVTGIGNYTGTVKLDYTITAKEVSIIGAAIQSVTYDPNGYTLTVTGVTFDGVVDGENLAYTAEAILGNTNAFGEQDATVTVTLNNSNYNLATATYQTKVTINKAAATVTAAPTPNTLTYTGEAQYLINAGEANGGTMHYSTDNQTWSTTIPQGTDAGEYTVYYKVIGDANHSDTAVDSVEVTIAKAQAVITVDTTTITVTYGKTVSLPTATTNFGAVVCDKTAADLVNAGTYTVTYTVAGTDNFEGATKTLTVKVEQLAVAEPTVTSTYTYTGKELTAQLIGVESCMTVASGNKATNAGNYEVQVTLDGNHQWADGSDGKVQWSIAKAQATITVDTDPISVTYGEAVQLPVASSNFGTVSCDKQASDLVNAGTYTVTYTVAGTNNFDGDTKTLTVTVAKKTVAEPTVSGTYTYTGSGQTVILDGFDGEYMTIVSGSKGTNAADYEVVITLDGNHQWADDSDGKVTWTIAPASLETAIITLDQTTYIYDGQSHYPAVTVTLDGRTLKEDTDYEVFYVRPRTMVNGKPTKWFGDPIISGACIHAHDDYYAVVLGLGNYYTKNAFTLYQNFVIQPRPLTIKATDQTILRYASINSGSISITEGSLLQGHTLTGYVFVQNAFDEGQNVQTIVGTHKDALYIDEMSVVIKAGEEAVTGNYSITQEKGTLTVVEHTHQWSYTASGDTITAKCEGTIGQCDVETVIIKLNAPADLSYNGSEKSVTVTQNPAGILPDVPAVEYQGDRKGTGDHTAKLTIGGATAQLTFTITCEHSFQAVEYLWNADNTACTVTGTCEKGCGATAQARATVTSQRTKEPTCEDKGETTYTATFQENWAQTQTETAANIPALNHAWTVSYTWSEDGKTCTATRICGNDAKHNVTVNGKITSAIKTPATCEEKGWTTYTAAFDADWAQDQTRDVEDIPALNHAWTVEYTFAADGKTCTATRVCGNDADHNVTAQAAISSQRTKEPTTTTLGETTYTASFTEDWAETQSKTVADIPMLNDVVIPDDIQGGDVTVDNATPAIGDKVTVTVTPHKGQKIEDVTVTGPDGKEIDVTDNGDGTFSYAQPEGDVTVDVTFAIESIQVVPVGENPLVSGKQIQIDGVTVTLDSDGELWLQTTGSQLLTTYTYAANEDGKQYPTGMQAWYLNWEDSDGDGEIDTCKAQEIPELENFMTYQGTSIRVGHTSDGIRFFTAVPGQGLDLLMDGRLLTGELEGYKLVEMGTLYKWAKSGTELLYTGNAKSYVYGGSAGTSFRVFSQQGSDTWFTGMLTELPGDAATLSADIVSRPYAILADADGNTVTIYGGIVIRSVYDVAKQNKDYFAQGSAFDNYVENIITTVDNSNG